MSSMRAVLYAAAVFLAALSVTGQNVSITGFSPTYGMPDDQVIIMGSGFSSGQITVRFWNNVVAYAEATSDTIVYAYVPAGAQTGRISVQRDAGQQVFSTAVFTVIGAGPYVTSFSPAGGSGGTKVFIEGAHFTEATAVRFNGTDAPDGGISSDTLLWAEAPANVTTGPITVVTTKGSYTTTSNYFGAPLILTFSPASGRTSTNVVITGRNLVGVSTVWFNDLPATSFTVNSATQITATVPTNATTGVVGLENPVLGSFTQTNFTVLPTLYGFSPGFGAGGTTVTLTGANFNVGTPSVKFNGVQAATPTGVTFSQMTVKVPAGATTGPITVTTAAGSHTNENYFYIPASITSFTPTNSPTGSTVTITGNNLLGATQVRFGGVTASFSPPTNNTTLLATVPDGVITGPIAVVTPAGTATSSQNFYGPPLISNFTPTHGLPGTNVTINGTNFLGTTAVRFNGSNAVVTSVTNGRITARVPTGATTGPITVEAPGGTNVSSAVFTLDYTSDLAMGVTAGPNPVFVGSNLVYSLSVTNKGPFDAPDVQLANTLGDGVLLKSATTTRGTLDTNANPIVASLDTMAVGATATITLTVVPTVKGFLKNLALAISGYSDPVSTNNNIKTITTVLPWPILSIRKGSENRVQLSWPVELTNYLLEYKPGFASTNYWSNSTIAPTISGGEKHVNDYATNAARFYRLRK